VESFGGVGRGVVCRVEEESCGEVVEEKQLVDCRGICWRGESWRGLVE